MDGQTVASNQQKFFLKVLLSREFALRFGRIWGRRIRIGVRLPVHLMCADGFADQLASIEVLGSAPSIYLAQKRL
jgi:hypothetical protein